MFGNFKKLSLRTHIFLSMILLILLTYSFIAIITIFQYKKQTENYNASRFERKENAVRLNINYVLHNTEKPLITKNLQQIFERSIFEISSVHKVTVKIYDLKGVLLISSDSISKNTESKKTIDKKDLQLLKQKSVNRIQGANIKGERLQTSYTYIYNENKTPIGILKLQYLQDNSVQEKDLGDFLYRLGVVCVIIFFIAIIFAYFLSSYITLSLKTIIHKMSQTGLNKRNEKIVLGEVSVEIRKLVETYNDMLEKLEESAIKLAKSEREQAWNQMARQVAHEIKNPLTPMRLTVQSFEKKFDPTKIDSKEKLKEYSKTLIQQIDVMSSIASAFSDFAKMPPQRKEKIEIVSIIKMALDIFDKNYIKYNTTTEKSYVNLDKSQIVRVITNIIQNAIQATEDIKNPSIKLYFSDKGETIEIKISDNGRGIKEENKKRIFEPKFTTKSSGMGLGLVMVKKIVEGYGGSIRFVSQKDAGTTFIMIIPKNK